MSKAVLDASAVLSLLNAEPGADAVVQYLPGAAISTVNVTEVLTRLIDWGLSVEEVRTAFEALGLEQHSFDSDRASDAAWLRGPTRAQDLSLGDRACLALARHLGLPVLTADRAWLSLDIGIEITNIRPEK